MVKEYFDADQSAAYCITEHNNFIYSTGTHRNLELNYQGIFITKLDQQGNVLSYKEYFDLQDPLFFQNLISDVWIVDAYLYAVVSSGTSRDRIVKYSLENDIIDSIYFIPSLLEPGPPKIRSLGKYDNELIILSNNIDLNPSSFDTKIIVQFGLQENGRRISIDRLDKKEIAHKIHPTENGNLLISNSLFESNLFHANVNLIEIDTVGNIIWEYQIQNGYSAFCKDFVNHDNGDKVLIYLEVNDSEETRPVIEKIDSVGGLLWQRRIGGNLWDRSVRSFWNRIVKSNEGDGYIFAGLNEETVVLDSTQIHGVVGKLSLNGDSLWYKRFTIETEEEVSRHSINDLEKTSDGYIAAGLVQYRYVNGDRPVVQSYFIKMDKGQANILCMTTCR